MRCCSEMDNDELKTISLPCSGKIDVLYLIKAFETGADGVVVVTCRKGECRYLEGNLRARKRAEAVDALLEEIGLSRGHMAVIQLKEGGTNQLIREIEDFRAVIRELLQTGDSSSAQPHTNSALTNTSRPETH